MDEEEVRPMPPHVHSGFLVNGKMTDPRKIEAYFFPPVDLSPYNKTFGKTITRLGLKKEVTKEEFMQALKSFGKSDKMYKMLHVYEIKPCSGWLTLPGTVHSPGPWTTLEIQLPQDDWNYLCWRIDQKFNDKEIEQKRKELMLRGLKDEEDVFNQTVRW